MREQKGKVFEDYDRRIHPVEKVGVYSGILACALGAGIYFYSNFILDGNGKRMEEGITTNYQSPLEQEIEKKIDGLEDLGTRPS